MRRVAVGVLLFCITQLALAQANYIPVSESVFPLNSTVYNMHIGILAACWLLWIFFSKTGLIIFSASNDAEVILDAALEHGADDVQTDDDGSTAVYTPPYDMPKIRQELSKQGLDADSSEITMTSSTEVDLDLSAAEKLLRLIDNLEDLDDVQNVYHNAIISDEVAQQL